MICNAGKRKKTKRRTRESETTEGGVETEQNQSAVPHCSCSWLH